MAHLLGESSATRSSSRSLEKNGIVWKLKQSFTREYMVLADYFDEDESKIRAVAPQPGGRLNYGSPFVCKSAEISEKEEIFHPRSGKLTLLWKVACSFETDLKTDPLELDPEVRWTSEQEETAFCQDVETGKPIQTAVGEMIPATISRIIPILEIKRYMPFPFDPNIITTFTNTLNQNEFWGAPAKHALLQSIECEYAEMTLTDTVSRKFAHVSYRIKFRFDPNTDEPWNFCPLHYGNQAFGSTGEPYLIKDTEGRPHPALLTEDGYELSPSQDPYFLSFHQYRAADWTSLGIDMASIIREQLAQE